VQEVTTANARRLFGRQGKVTRAGTAP
jgi:hypothetical protein